MELIVEFGPWGPRYKPVRGELWRVFKLGVVREAGTGDTVWEALAWCMVEIEERRLGVHRMARGTETPAERLAQLRAMSQDNTSTSARASVGHISTDGTRATHADRDQPPAPDVTYSDEFRTSADSSFFTPKERKTKAATRRARTKRK